MNSPFSVNVTPDWEGFVRCIKREGTPERVHFIELFLDGEIQNAICERYGVLDGLDRDDPSFPMQYRIALQSFLGYDTVSCGVEGKGMQFNLLKTTDSAALQRQNGRTFMDEHRGPITNWEEFEAYPWPDPDAVTTNALEWLSENLPENMCIIGAGGCGNFIEFVTWLMGYETLCYALYDQRDLVIAILDRLSELFQAAQKKVLQFERVKLIWVADDMGWKSATLISAKDMRELILPRHKVLAEISHAAGRPHMLHACGNLTEIMDDLIDDVGIDAKHSFEDTIEDVRDLKGKYGDRIALLGGIDVDFLCRADESQIRERVRDTLEKCLPGGGYCLGSGNSVANYIPVNNYLTMLDEGRKFKP